MVNVPGLVVTDLGFVVPRLRDVRPVPQVSALTRDPVASTFRVPRDGTSGGIQATNTHPGDTRRAECHNTAAGIDSLGPWTLAMELNMNWRDALFGKKPQQQDLTRTPPPANPFINVAQRVDDAGAANRGLWNSLRGKAPAARLVCRHGHPIARGDSICAYGHAIG